MIDEKQTKRMETEQHQRQVLSIVDETTIGQAI
jgi:hypothetical protein